MVLGYAVWAVPLLLIRTWSTRALLATAALSAASVWLYQVAAAEYLRLSAGPNGPAAAVQARQAAAAATNAALHAAEAQTSYRALLAARLDHMAWFHSQPFFFMPGATLALFIAGFLFVRHRVFEDVTRHRRLLGSLGVFGVVSWLAANWLLPLWNLDAVGILRDQWLTFTYVGGALILLAQMPGLASSLRPVANAGRMALTNYLLQIAALDLLFSAYALGLGQIRPVFGPPAALACFAAEAAFSTLWLRHFRFGPAEWLWRSLTYRRLQPMRRATLPAASATYVA